MAKKKPDHGIASDDAKRYRRPRGPLPRDPDTGMILKSDGTPSKMNAPAPQARNAKTHDVRALARQHGPDAIRFLAEVMNGGPLSRTGKKPAKAAYKPADRLRAAQELLDRGYGKAPATIDLSEGLNDVIGLTGDELTRNIIGGIGEIAAAVIAGINSGKIIEGSFNEAPDPVHPVHDAEVRSWDALTIDSDGAGGGREAGD